MNKRKCITCQFAKDGICKVAGIPYDGIEEAMCMAFIKRDEKPTNM